MRKQNNRYKHQHPKPNMKLTILLFLLIIANLVAFSQNVTNVQVEQIGKMVRVTYTLDKTADITMHLSTDGGVTYSEALKQVTGDVGKAISIGTHTIVWDVLLERENLKGDNIVFMVKATSKSYTQSKISKPRFRFDKITYFTINYGYSSAPQSSYGFTIGQVSKYGWYISAMSNFNFQGLFNPFEESIYQLNGESSTTRLSLSSGLLIRFWEPITLKVGAGIGYRAFNLQTQDGMWFSYPQRTFFGIDMSVGLTFHLKRFLISTEVVSTNFKYLETKLGIGWCF